VKFELFVASRYLRAKRRQAVIGVITVISVIGVTAGVASLVIALSINAGFQKDLQDQLLGSQSHINLVRTENDGIENWRELMTRLAKNPHVIGVAPAMYGQVLASRGARASGALLKGIIPEYENQVGELLKTIKFGSGDALRPCKETDEACKTGKEIPPVVLGKDLGETIGAKVDSIIMIISPQGELSPLGMMPRYQQFKVVGIFRSGFYNYDSAWGFIRLSDAQRLFSLPDSVISVIEFKIDDLYKADQVGSELEKAAGPGFAAKSWMEENRALFRALKLERVVTFLTIGLIVFVAALNILISLIMMVMEKTKDIAVLVSMGAKRRQIRGIFMFQGMLIGVIGTMAGLIVGYAVALAGAKYHFVKLSSEVYSIDYLPFAPRVLDGVLIAAVALLISFVATLYPSWSAARVLPAEALRYE
jgi:lipoprotein-releasing system permease protein